MKQVLLTNFSNPSAPTLRVKFCDDFFSRFRGLMFTASLPKDHGILLVEPQESIINTSIHMFFMNFDIAVIWLSSHYKVVDACYARAWRPLYKPRTPAKFVLETRTENLPFYHIGDEIQVHEI
ncbi:uncharacterized conserved protein [Anaerolinea thermolimosa]|uniref:DUF192 domain-containing protein n=1 Tax=Anaerolinea thermolimosa TaxID=229919 RepID=UPI000780F2DE|nr:DUF192 domain-containing protein [Anaerolinea thermolimosa]GAP06493.1 uncharacterized conserved protein [Anaerolinea thermolimosa]